MSELQIGLLVLGALALVALLAYNRWADRAHAPRQADGHAGDGHGSDAPTFTEPAFDDSSFSSLNLSVATPRRPAIDDLIDAVAAVNQTLACLPSRARPQSPPFRAVGAWAANPS
jgi:hypothetical protein